MASEIEGTGSGGGGDGHAACSAGERRPPDGAKCRCIRILCFGDSLTAGYHEWGAKWAPYGVNLRKELQKLLGSDTASSAAATRIDVHVDVIGLSGWTSVQMDEASGGERCTDVCGKTWKGLETAIRDAAAADSAFDVVTIMAGTNDVGGTDVEDSWAAIRSLHRKAHALGPRTVALAMPEHCQEREAPMLKTKRMEIARRLQAAAGDLSASSSKSGAAQSMKFVDGASFVPFFDVSDEERELHWDDGLHMTAAGYAAFGAKLAEALAPWLESIIQT